MAENVRQRLHHELNELEKRAQLRALDTLSGPTSPNSGEQCNEKTPLLAKEARNGGSDQVDRKPKQPECHPALLESCHSFQASIFGEPACIAQAGKGSVLIDSKNADGAGT